MVTESTGEIWARVEKGSCYWVSNNGRARVDKRTIRYKNKNGVIWNRVIEAKILKISYTREGYGLVSIRAFGKKSMLIHRAVAIVFVPNPNNLPEINHIDMDKTNNRPSNLEWCTNWSNIKHAIANGRHIAKLNDNIAEDIRHKRFAEGMSMNKIASIYGIGTTTVYNIVSRKTWNKCNN